MFIYLIETNKIISIIFGNPIRILTQKEKVTNPTVKRLFEGSYYWVWERWSNIWSGGINQERLDDCLQRTRLC